ncbi:hypothetical protein HZH68_016240 [Vespula germanica]|uniref:Uncharacterized protein n=1 Tax=Vespula germanica TaxID=30212 RepID=A0A834MPV7_VESGE|nr:hypothetical protein HZH68_016240 [Vespula germanica]
MGEIGHVKENPGAINKDSKNEDLLIDVEEEKEEKGDKCDEDIQGECKDYLSTLAHDLIGDRFYLDADDSTDKFNSNQIDVYPWPNIDFANFDLNLTNSYTVYRKNEVKWIIETIGNNKYNKKKTENDIENRTDCENGRFNHVLQNELIKIGIKSR